MSASRFVLGTRGRMRRAAHFDQLADLPDSTQFKSVCYQTASKWWCRAHHIQSDFGDDYCDERLGQSCLPTLGCDIMSRWRRVQPPASLKVHKMAGGGTHGYVLASHSMMTSTQDDMASVRSCPPWGTRLPSTPNARLWRLLLGFPNPPVPPPSYPFPTTRHQYLTYPPTSVARPLSPTAVTVTAPRREQTQSTQSTPYPLR